MYEDYGIPFMGALEVARALGEALKKGRGFSLIRMGGGEVKSLGHDLILSSREITKNYQYDYAGVQLPDEKLRKEMLWGIRQAHVVGVLPAGRSPELIYLFKTLKARPRRICSAYINWILHDEGKGPLYTDLGSPRIFLIGRRAGEALAHARYFGLQVEGWTSFEGFSDHPRALKEVVRAKKAQLVLVSAGVGSVILCSRIARETNKVAFDFGHVMDRLIDLDFGSHNLLEKKHLWRQNKKGLA